MIGESARPERPHDENLFLHKLSKRSNHAREIYILNKAMTVKRRLAEEVKEVQKRLRGSFGAHAS